MLNTKLDQRQLGHVAVRDEFNSRLAFQHDQELAAFAGSARELGGQTTNGEALGFFFRGLFLFRGFHR